MTIASISRVWRKVVVLGSVHPEDEIAIDFDDELMRLWRWGLLYLVGPNWVVSIDGYWLYGANKDD